MAKRGALSQINKDNAFDSDPESEGESAHKAKVASASTLAGRRIIKPKSKRVGAGSGASLYPKLKFGGSQEPASLLNKDGDAAKTNPFALLTSSNKENGALTASKSLYPSLSNSVDDPASIASEIKALNDNFVAALTLSSKQAPLGDYTDYCEKYINYFKQIRERRVASGSLLGSSAVTVENKKELSAAPQKTISTVKADSDDDGDDHKVEIKGPLFTINKKVSDSTFSFGKTSTKPVEPPKGPVFTFNATGKKPNTAFTWGKKQTLSNEDNNGKKEQVGQNDSTPGFAFGKTAENKKDSTPGFAFGKTTETKNDLVDSVSKSTKKDSTSVFSFGKNTVETTKPDLDFKPNSEKPAKNTAFLFGSNKPAFSFQKNDNDTKTDGDKQQTPSLFGSTNGAFNFAKSSEKTDESTAKPSSTGFSFGAASNTDKPKPFSFGAKPNDESTTKPFSFGAKPNDESTTKPFSFGKNDESTTKPFSFGNKPEEKTEKPTFNFGASKNETSSPLFANKDTSSKPVFNFGASSATEKPLFSFGNSSEKPTFNFGASSSFSFNSTAKPEAKKEKEESTSAQNESTETHSESAAPSDEVLAGEENENVKFNKKSKLLLFNGTEYETKGLGFLKVLENKDNKKRRLVLRSEGSQRVVFNQYVLKNHTYTKVGKNAVQVPVLEGETMKMYLLRVKDIDELLTVLNESAQT